MDGLNIRKILPSTLEAMMGNAGHFWARKYGHRKIGEKELEDIRIYIRNQKRIPRA